MTLRHWMNPLGRESPMNRDMAGSFNFLQLVFDGINTSA